MKKSDKVTDADFKRMKRVSGEHDKYVDKSFNFYFSFQLRVLFMVCVMLVIAVLSYFCFRAGFSDSNKTTLLVSKSANVETDVKVKNNDTFVYNGSDEEIYLSDLIDDLYADVEYQFNGNLNGKYSYDIEANAIMTLMDGNQKVVSINESQLMDKKNVVVSDEFDTSDILVKERLVLDYDKFNKAALDIKNTYGLNLNGNILVNITVNVFGEIEGFKKSIQDTQEIHINVPLLSNNVEVKLIDTDLSNAKFTSTEKPQVTNEHILYLGIVLLVVDVILLLLLVRFWYSVQPKKSKYCTLRDGILKDYDDIIVNSRKVPKIEKYNIIDCYSFSELLDAQKLLDKPIVYYEIVKNQKCMFVLIGDNDIYKFTLKECDIDY